jgi:toxin ParE1/3/4
MMIKWLDDAIYDLQALRQYIAQDKPIAANRLAKQILKAVNLLSDFPSMGRPGRILGTRELIVSNTPYIIPYRVKNNFIEILRVLHAAMKWPEEFWSLN